MNSILHLAALVGVCLGVAVFVILALSAYVVRLMDQELADVAASAPQLPGPRMTQAPQVERVDMTGAETFTPAP